MCAEGVLLTFDTLKRLDDKAGVTYVTEQRERWTRIKKIYC